MGVGIVSFQWKETQMTVEPAPRQRPKRTATTPLGKLELLLNECGIPPDRFAQAAASALEDLRTSAGPVVEEPGTQFSETERRTLDAGGLDLTPRRTRGPDPRMATAARFAGLLADSEDVGEVAQRLGVTRARIRQRALDRSLLAIREGDEWRFPRAQFNDGAPIRGLPAVSLALPPDLHPVVAWRFLSEPNGDLELDEHAVSPIDWLRSGGSPDPVVAIAREL
jgi:hypothetical protein